MSEISKKLNSRQNSCAKIFSTKKSYFRTIFSYIYTICLLVYWIEFLDVSEKKVIFFPEIQLNFNYCLQVIAL